MKRQVLVTIDDEDPLYVNTMFTRVSSEFGGMYSMTVEEITTPEGPYSLDEANQYFVEAKAHVPGGMPDQEFESAINALIDLKNVMNRWKEFHKSTSFLRTIALILASSDRLQESEFLNELVNDLVQIEALNRVFGFLKDKIEKRKEDAKS